MEYELQTTEQSADWFLDNVIVSDINTVIQSGAGYLAFALIAQAIELLGALLDEQEFSESRLSEDRFAKAISVLFVRNPQYAEMNKKDSDFYLYEHLRCGMAHILRPKARVIFVGENDAKRMSLEHLKVQTIDGYSETQLVLILENLYEDLKEACRRAKILIKKKTHPKLKQGYLKITRYTYRFNDAAQAFNFQKGSNIEVNTPSTNGPFTIVASITGAK
jgi:hypothetical protein